VWGGGPVIGGTELDRWCSADIETTARGIAAGGAAAIAVAAAAGVQ